MGTSCSSNVTAHGNEERFKLHEPKSGLSDWYKACRDGNTVKLLTMLPFLTFDQLNRTEETNGSTCLHVACFRNHVDVATILLVCGCDRNRKNKHGLTPLDEAKSAELRNLFSMNRVSLWSSVGHYLEVLTADEFAPYNKFIIGHVNYDHIYDAKEMIKMYRSSGPMHFLTSKTVAKNSYSELFRIINESIPKNDPLYETATGYLNKWDPFSLIKLYSLNSEFYRNLQKDNTAFTANIFVSLAKFKNRAFKGRSYRGTQIAHFDVNAWKWATLKADRLIELQMFTSTSELPQIAQSFAVPSKENKVGVLFIFNFPEKCDTAIKLNADESNNIKDGLSVFPEENEILVIPYTLFKVESVNFNEGNKCYRIELTNVPINL